MSHASKAPGAGLGIRQENRLYLTASSVGTRSPTWTIAVARKGLELAPQQMPGTQSQLGGLEGGRWKTSWKITEWGLNSGTSGSEPRTQNHYTTHTHTYTHIYSFLTSTSLDPTTRVLPSLRSSNSDLLYPIPRLMLHAYVNSYNNCHTHNYLHSTNCKISLLTS